MTTQKLGQDYRTGNVIVDNQQLSEAVLQPDPSDSIAAVRSDSSNGDGTLVIEEYLGTKEAVDIEIEAFGKDQASRDASDEAASNIIKSPGGQQEHPGHGGSGGGDNDGLPPTYSIDGDNIDELMDHLNRSGKQWSYDWGDSYTAIVKFPQSVADLTPYYQERYGEPEAVGEDAVTGFTVAQRAAIIDQLNKQWGGVADIEFIDGGSIGPADIYLFGRHLVGSGEGGNPGGRSGGVNHLEGTVVRINTDSPGWDQFEPGDAGYRILLHEVGHAIGFSHPGDYDNSDAKKPTYENNADYIQDTKQYTVMSYFDMENSGATNTGGDPITSIRSHDMWVAQRMYGVNEDANLGDTTYGYNVTAGLEGTQYEFTPFNFNNAPYLTIFDAHGDNDKLDLSMAPSSVTLNLNPGAFSSTHGQTNNISLAHLPPWSFDKADRNAYIENGVGSQYDDVLIGSDVDNVLDGQSGSDTLLGGDGDDELIGGFGDDYLVGGVGVDFFDGGSGFDKVDFSYSSGDWTINLHTLVDGEASTNAGSETLVSIEAIQGSKGNDTINGSIDGNWIDGGFGDDVIDGGAGDDTLYGNLGTDIIFAGNGTDVADGGDGADTIDFTHAFGNWNIDLSLQSAANGLGDSATLSKFEHVRASFGDDDIAGDGLANTIWGGHGQDIINGRTGDDALFGEGDDDKLDGSFGNDVLAGGAGEDTAVYMARFAGVTVDLQKVGWQTIDGSEVDFLVEIENLTGSNYDDVLQGDAGENWLIGQAGDDQLNGRDDDDRLEGGEGDDFLEGGLGNDLLFGGDGVDLVTYTTATAGVVIDLNHGPGEGPDHDTGSAGIDSYFDIEGAIGSDFADSIYGDGDANELHGADGNDYIVGNIGHDELRGGGGNDTLSGGLGNDILDGGDGVDWVTFGTNAGVTVDLSKTQQLTGQGSDYIVNVENVKGLHGDDELYGNDVANTLYGLGGDDILYGGGAEDVLRGGAGNDLIYASLSDGGNRPVVDDFFNVDHEVPTRDGIDDLFRALSPDLDDGLIDYAATSKAIADGVAAAAIDGIQAPDAGNDHEPGGNQPIGGGLDLDLKIEDGSGPDRIVFEDGWGDDQVFDFTPGGDVLDFALVTDVDELLDLSISDTADGVVISDDQNSVLLHDIEQADLSAGDFLFV